MSEQKTVYIDVETNGLRADAQLLWIGVRINQNPVEIFNPRVDYSRLVEIMELQNAVYVGHNFWNFDLPRIARFLSWEPSQILQINGYDTLLAARTLELFNRAKTRFSYGHCLKRYLNVEIDKDIDHNMWETDELSPRQLEYLTNDVKYLQDLHLFLLGKAEDLDADLPEGLPSYTLGVEINQRMGRAAAVMQYNGIPVNPYGAARSRVTDWLKENLDTYPVNPNSSKQVLEYLQSLGSYSENTRKQTLHLLTRSYDKNIAAFAQWVLDCRKYGKLKSFFSSWIDDAVEGRLHAQFKPTGTDTGRFSCTNPNMQQVPRALRGAFFAPKGYQWVKADYAKLEIVVGAVVMQVPEMIEALLSEDLHTTTAKSIFCTDTITPTQRQLAKAASFTLLFAGSQFRLFQYVQDNMDLSEFNVTAQELAHQIYYGYFNRFPNLQAYHNAIAARAARLKQRGKGELITFSTGQRLVIPKWEIRPTKMINNRVQGAAAAGLKHAIDRLMCTTAAKYLVATVHDELDFIIPENEVEECMTIIEHCMIEGMYDTLTYINADLANQAKPAVIVEFDVGNSWK